MMCTRTIATGAGITGSADCPQAFTRRVVSSAGPLALCGLLPRRRSGYSAQSLTHANRTHTHSIDTSGITSALIRRPTAAAATAPTAVDGGHRRRLGNGSNC